MPCLIRPLGLLFKGRGAGALCCLLLMVLVGCADTTDSRRRDADAVGSIAFSVVWEDNDSLNPMQPRFVCGSGDNEVVEVTALISNGAHTKRPDANWDCWSGRGTLSKVPVGSNYTLTVIGYNANGETTYCAERSGITVQKGINDVGTVAASRFETAGNAPADNAVNVDPESITFSWDETIGATQYRLQISESANFSVWIQEDTAGLSYTVTNDAIQSDTPYWWRVIPLNIDGMTGYLSPENVYAFTTSSFINPLPDDAYEENDTLDSAYDLTASREQPLSEINGLGIVNADDPIDFFQIDLNADVVWLYVDCYHTHADGDIDIALFSSDGTLLAEAISIDDNESLAFDLSAYPAGSYYIGVVLVDNSNANAYDLQFDYSACPAGDDYGDRMDAAATISTNSTVQGEIECSYDEDYLRFELSASRVVSIYTEGAMDTVGLLLDADGTELNTDDDGGSGFNFLIQGTLPAGTYYVVVEGFEDDTGAYDLTVSLEPSAPAISGIYDVLVDPFADYCVNSQGDIFSGFNYNVYFDYDDPDGDAGEGDGAYVSVNGTDWNWATIGGDGSSGTVTISYCSATAGHTLVILMIDGEGLESNSLSINLTDYP